MNPPVTPFQISAGSCLHRLRSSFFLFLILPILASCSGGTDKESEMPPSFIFIAIDDLNIYNTVLGSLPGNFLEKVYPDPEVRRGVVSRLTPNLQELAREGLVFTRAFCPYPLCGPSRTALLTGVPAHVSGYIRHDRHFRAYETLTDAVTLPQYLRLNGYYTSGIGKVFHKGRSYLDRGFFSDWPDQLYSWSEWVEMHTGTGTPGPVEGKKETLSPYWPRGDLPATHYTRFGVSHLPREQTFDYLNARHIADLILEGESVRTDLNGETRRIVLPSDRPFFLACGLFAPHLPWMAQEEFYERFPEEEMSIGRDLLEWVRLDLEDLSESGQRMTAGTHFTRLLEHGLETGGEDGDLNAWRAAFRAYLATIAYSDANLGVLLEAIRNNPRRENTVVVLWSDHGYHLGDKNRTGKNTPWDAANHCNLIILDPSRSDSHAGKTTDAPVNLQDLYPTLISMAGLDRPGHVHGYDLAPLLEDPGTEWNHPVLNTIGEGLHTLRTPRYRYVRFGNGDRELYHLGSDPFERVNLAGHPEWMPVRDSLDRVLDRELLRPADGYR